MQKIILIATLALVSTIGAADAHDSYYQRGPVMFQSPKPAYRYLWQIPGGYTVIPNRYGHGYTVIPNNPAYGYTPMQPYCREYQEKTTVGGKVVDSYGTACMQPDGSWRKVD